MMIGWAQEQTEDGDIGPTGRAFDDVPQELESLG
jgi:hypothetical protein